MFIMNSFLRTNSTGLSEFNRFYIFKAVIVITLIIVVIVIIVVIMMCCKGIEFESMLRLSVMELSPGLLFVARWWTKLVKPQSAHGHARNPIASGSERVRMARPNRDHVISLAATKKVAWLEGTSTGIPTKKVVPWVVITSQYGRAGFDDKAAWT